MQGAGGHGGAHSCMLRCVHVLAHMPGHACLTSFINAALLNTALCRTMTQVQTAHSRAVKSTGST